MGFLLRTKKIFSGSRPELNSGPPDYQSSLMTTIPEASSDQFGQKVIHKVQVPLRADCQFSTEVLIAELS